MNSEFPSRINKYFEKGVEAFLSHVSINCIVFGFDDPQLKILVQRLWDEDVWFLPGGHVYVDEHLDTAARRNLKLSGLDNLFLRQFKTFGQTDRMIDNAPINPAQMGMPKEIFEWVTQRFVSVGYYALVHYDNVHIQPGLFSNKSKWLDVNDINVLALDHSEMVKEARRVLSEDLLSFPVVANLLSDTFTIPELRKLYESILNRSIDRGTFRRKMINSNILEKVGKQAISVRRPATIYKLNQESYIRSLMEETKFGF